MADYLQNVQHVEAIADEHVVGPAQVAAIQNHVGDSVDAVKDEEHRLSHETVINWQ